MNADSAAAWLLFAPALLTLAVSVWRISTVWPIVLRVLRRNRIRYARWDRGMHANLQFLKLAANEPRPSRRRVYQALRRSLLLAHLGMLLFVALIVGGMYVGGRHFPLTEPDPPPERTESPVQHEAPNQRR